jgi:hypothetical protein
MTSYFLRIIPFLTLFSQILATAELAITANRGVPISVNGKAEVAVGQTFAVVVSVKSSGPLTEPTIGGLGQLTRLGSSSSSKFLMQNGAMTAERSFIYSMRADKEGEYIIGPAQLIVDGKSVTTERIKLIIRAESKTDRRGPAFIEMSVNKNAVMVGEPVTVILKLYMQDGVELAQPFVANFTGAGWTVHSSVAKPAYNKTVQGNVYRVNEQHLVISSPISGTVTIPAMTAFCAIAQQAPNIFDLFGFGVRQSETFSVSTGQVSIAVKPLPAYKGTVHGMGIFSNFVAELTSLQAKVGEGVVVRLSVEGNNDMQQVTAPTLQLPEGLTSYESNHHVQEIAENHWRKTFEYIVQGLQPGSFTIKPQAFTYFDHAQCVYKTLRTQPVTLKVTGAAVATPAEPMKQAVVEPLATPTKVSTERTIVAKQVASYIPLLLGLLVAIIILGFILYKLLRWLRRPLDLKATAFSRARKQFAQLKKTNNTTGVYLLFVNLFADRLEIPAGHVTEQLMYDVLKKRGMPTEKIDQWMHDFVTISAAAYAPMIVKEQLMTTAERWLRELGSWI